MRKKTTRKKSGTLRPITPFRLSEEARKELETSAESEGRSMREIVEDRICGRDRFNPAIETLITEYQKRHKCGRNTAMEALMTR